MKSDRKRKRQSAIQSTVGEPTEKTPCLVTCVQEILRKQLSQGTQPPRIHGFQQERRCLLDLVRRTATTGESNSVLVIGPRGSGKSVLIDNVLQELFSDDNTRRNVLLVRLNGLLQTDDKIAMKEITRQLQLENCVGDRVFGSFAENLQFLLEALKSGDQSSKPVIFILDEFDLFAHHKNQTLLYNLFDVAQSAQAPVCVVGVTCRLDVIELLEKRVKSRFSHRQIHMFNNLKFDDYCDVFRMFLVLGDDFKDKKFVTDWNNHIEALSKEPSVIDVLKRRFEFNKDIRALQQLLVQPICKLSESHPRITASDIVDCMKILTTDTKSSMLHGISILELCLIIAMKHLTEIYEGEPFNFEMVYSEYSKFAQRRSSMQIFEKAVVLKAFEHLLSLELVKSIDGSGTRIQKEYRLMSLLIHPSQILDALQKYPNCPTDIKQWASNAVAT